MSSGRLLGMMERKAFAEWWIKWALIAEKLEALKELTSQNDRSIWKAEKDGCCTVKSCFRLLNNNARCNQWPWKILWKCKAPLKVMYSTWIASDKACLTQANLQRGGISMCTKFFLCNEA